MKNHLNINKFLKDAGEVGKILKEKESDLIPQPIQKEEVKEGMFIDYERMDRLTALRKLEDEEDKESLDTPTPSDTFIDEKMKEFEQIFFVKDGTIPVDTYIDVRQFLKSSLQEQREIIEREKDKEWMKTIFEKYRLKTLDELLKDK